MRDRTDALGADLDAETSAGADAGKESADTAVTVRSDKLSLSVTLWHRADHEPLELPGVTDAGSPAAERRIRHYCSSGLI